MKLSQYQSILKNQVGACITNCSVELWNATGEKVPISVFVMFDTGKSFVISCSGDGGIMIRDGTAMHAGHGTRYDSIDSVVDEEAVAIDFTEASISLLTRSNQLEIANRDDELTVTATRSSI